MFNFVFLCPKRWSQFNSRIVRTHFSSIMTLNNWKIITETRSYIFRWRSRFRRRRVCLSSLFPGNTNSQKRSATALATLHVNIRQLSILIESIWKPSDACIVEIWKCLQLLKSSREMTRTFKIGFYLDCERPISVKLGAAVNLINSVVLVFAAWEGARLQLKRWKNRPLFSP